MQTRPELNRRQYSRKPLRA